jgi:hypothetical protein
MRGMRESTSRNQVNGSPPRNGPAARDAARFCYPDHGDMIHLPEGLERFRALRLVPVQAAGRLLDRRRRNARHVDGDTFLRTHDFPKRGYQRVPRWAKSDEKSKCWSALSRGWRSVSATPDRIGGTDTPERVSYRLGSSVKQEAITNASIDR